MEHQNKRRLAALLAAFLSLTLVLTGCSEDEEWDVLDDVDQWEEDRGTHWWDNPGQGGTTQEDWSDESDFQWWNALDESWDREDWEYMEDDVWMIFDEESQMVYLYDEEFEEFAAMDPETEEIFFLDQDSGEWIPGE